MSMFLVWAKKRIKEMTKRKKKDFDLLIECHTKYDLVIDDTQRDDQTREMTNAPTKWVQRIRITLRNSFILDTIVENLVFYMSFSFICVK